MANWDEQKPYVYKVNTDLSVRLLKELLEREFDVPFTSDGTAIGNLSGIVAASVRHRLKARNYPGPAPVRR
jgi:hypothetical protein